MSPHKETPLPAMLKGDDVIPTLRAVCDLSGGEYALFWNTCDGALKVEAEWTERQCVRSARHAQHLRSYIFTSSLTSFRPGQGAVGRVFQTNSAEFNSVASGLNKDHFHRNALAKRHGVRSIVFIPWNRGVLEYGSTESWTEAPLSAVPRGRVDDSVDKKRSFVEWEAVLHKQSRYLGLWRQRTVRLMDEGGRLRICSWRQTCFGPERLTGAWDISDDMRSLALRPVPGYRAGLEIDGLTLAANSALGASALKDLCSILRLRSTVSRLRSESDVSTEASGSDGSDSSAESAGCAKHAIDAVADFNSMP